MVALLKDISLAEPVRRAPARTGADHLYSTAALTNSAGAVVERYGYDAYGKRVTLDANGALRTAPAMTAVGFTGRTLDVETGLLDNRNRLFSIGFNRFISRDPYNRLGFPFAWYNEKTENGFTSLINYVRKNKPNGNIDTISQGELIEYVSLVKSRLASKKDYLNNRYSNFKDFGYHDGMNLYNGYHIPNGNDPFGLDNPGCDIPSGWGGDTANNSPCMLECCAAHDECYAKNCCTAKSWIKTAAILKGWFGIAICLADPCCRCNLKAVWCFATCIGRTQEDDPNVPNYYCPRQRRYITIGPGGDFPDMDSARRACSTD